MQVNSHESEFNVGDVSSPWDLAGGFREIFAFLQEELRDEDDIELQDVEYVAIIGMLKTLDPHTTLLTPDVYEEMRTSTRGQFGGLGIVISIRDGHLTVIKPIDDTPASKAGLQRGDRIVKIEGESTLNMPLSGAVDRLRGAPGSKVTIYIRRQAKSGAWSAPRMVTLTRDVIRIQSVEHRMLRDSVGYVKINNFQGNTERDLRKALESLHKKKMQGLVLDLRNNPGGLLDQAVDVADTFLEGGPIVTTSSQDPRQREEKLAKRPRTEPRYPMVVLMNAQSASASEIVAGALKNHDRALIIGEQSFGKGSVQVLYELQDRSALKLTVAQYLTPGDVSIQGVGIVPDIAISPMTVDKEDMDLKVNQFYRREADLDAHLTHDSATDTQRPSVVMGYYLNPELRQRLMEAEPDEEENEDQENFLIRFSKNLVLNAKSAKRPQMLRESAPIIARVQKQENEKVARDLEKLGIDWRVGKDKGPSKVSVVARTTAGDEPAKAGDPLSLEVSVTNEGKHTLYQLRGNTTSDYPLFDGREVVFGKLEPGETRSWTTTLGICLTEGETRECRLPRSAIDRADGIRIDFEEAHGHVPEPVEVRTLIESLPKPRFAYSIQIADNIQGNGDGLVQPGEHLTVYFTAKNVGEADSFAVQANVQNKSNEGVLLYDGRFGREEGIARGEEWVVPFTLRVNPQLDEDEVTLMLGVADEELGAAAGQKLTIPIVREPGTVTKVPPGTLAALPAGTAVLAKPSAGASVVGHLKSPARLPLQARSGEFARVDLGEGRPGWVAASGLETTKGSRTKVVLELATPSASPLIALESLGGYATSSDSIRLRGRATDDQKVRDLFITTSGHKVFYESNEGSASPRELTFDAEVPLHPGLNTIMVAAREDAVTVTRRYFVVRRDGDGGELLETAKFEGALFSNGNGYH